MQLEDYFEFIEPDHIRFKGHRVGIESILHKYLAGQPIEAIAHQYDSPRPVDIYATITYYLQNQAAVDAYPRRVDQLVAEDIARSDAAPPPTAERLRQVQSAALRDILDNGQPAPSDEETARILEEERAMKHDRWSSVS